MYKTTTNYETGTTITDRHVNTSGYWNEKTPISIIREAGVGDEYLGRAIGDPEDIILPTNYSLSAETGITEINVPETTRDLVWLAPEGNGGFHGERYGQESERRKASDPDGYRRLLYICDKGRRSIRAV